MKPGTVGRPPTCTCGDCRKCKQAAYMREWYRRKSPAERRALVAARPKPTSAQNRARYEKRRQDPEWRAREWARWTLRNAIRDGRAERQPCEVCGEPTAQAHHDDYSKPLDVRWLCAEHHGAAHWKAA